MDPYSGMLYESVDAAREAGVANPVEIVGARADVERISAAVSAQFAKEVKQRRAANKVAKASRRRNRGQR